MFRPKYSPGNNALKRQMNELNDLLFKESEDYVPPKLNISIQNQIRNARTAKKMTQKELAQKINERHNVIIDYENGKAVPSREVAKKISKVLGVPIKF